MLHVLLNSFQVDVMIGPTHAPTIAEQKPWKLMQTVSRGFVQPFRRGAGPRDQTRQQKGKEGNAMDMPDNMCEDDMETISTLQESDAH
nr:hypothetical protein [Tanacetum cinerariifolium]